MGQCFVMNRLGMTTGLGTAFHLHHEYVMSYIENGRNSVSPHGDCEFHDAQGESRRCATTLLERLTP